MTKDKPNDRRGIMIILLNLLAMLVIAFLLVLVTFQWMKSYTLHGQYISVPDVSGMYEEEAGQALAAAGLKYEVSDYKYDKSIASTRTVGRTCSTASLTIRTTAVST